MSTPPAPSRAAFAFIFVTVALDMLALGLAVPVLPRLLLDFEGGDIARAATISGLFGTAWAAMQFLFSPVLGALSDRFGRRPVVLLSNFGLGLDYLLMAVAPSLSWLFVGRLISGITSASYATAGAYIADVTPPEKRAARFGMLGAAFGLGFTIGPAVGGLLGEVNPRLPFWVAGGLSLANAIYGLFILPESLPRERRGAFEWRRAASPASFGLLRSHPEILGLAAAAVLSYAAHESLPSVFVLYTDFRYGWSVGTVGLALGVVGVCTTIVSGGLVGPIVRKIGERRTLLLGYTFGTLAFAALGLATRGAIFVAGLPFVSLWGIANPAMQGLMSRRVGPSEQGRLQGAIASLRGVTGILGPPIFTLAFATAVRTPGSPLPGAPYLLASLLLLAALAISWRVTRPSAATQVAAAVE